MKITWFNPRCSIKSCATCVSSDMVDGDITKSEIVTFASDEFFDKYGKNGFFAIYDKNDGKSISRTCDVESNEGRILKMKFMAKGVMP